MSKILVTGASGFIGQHLVPILCSLGHEVRCAVSKLHPFLDAPQVIVDKLENKPDWSTALDGIEIVIHLAARAHIMEEKALSPLDEYCKVNFEGTKHLASQAANQGVKRFVFLSSIKVNGEFTEEQQPFTEQSPALTSDPYGLSKLYAEQFLSELAHHSTMEYVVIRPPLIYGPRVKANFLKMLQLVSKKYPLPFKNVNNNRNLIYIDNLTSALCAVLEHPNAANQTYLVADNESVSLTQMLQKIAEGMAVPIFLLPIPIKLMNSILKLIGKANLLTRLFGSLEVSNDKIKKDLDWNPPFTATEGLIRTAQWYSHEFNT